MRYFVAVLVRTVGAAAAAGLQGAAQPLGRAQVGGGGEHLDVAEVRAQGHQRPATKLNLHKKEGKHHLKQKQGHFRVGSEPQ